MEQRNTQKIPLGEFAQKHLDFFKHTEADDREMYGFLDDMAFPDECWGLGFEMDCGHSFIETCGEDA